MKMRILKESLTGNYHPHGDESDATMVLAFAFGRNDKDRGLTNEELAKLAIIKSKELGIPIYAQLCVANCILDAGEQCTVVRPEKRWEHFYLSTGGVLGKIDKSLNLKNEQALLIAHAFHAPRADAETNKKRLNTVLPKELPKVWASDSILREAHCRNRILWSFREPFVIAINRITSKI